MNKKILVFIMLVLSGCATANTKPIPALAPAKNIGMQISCESPCKTEWERAQLWLAHHSSMKIQLVTDVLINTYNPTFLNYGFRVTREPSGSDGYIIRLEIGNCLYRFGCEPDPIQTRNAFYYYVKHGEDLLSDAGYVGQAIR